MKDSILGDKNKLSMKTVLPTVLLAVLSFVIVCITDDLYIAVDNYTISMVVNRLYALDNYCIYLHPFLCWFIGWISEIFVAGDGFALFSHVCIFLEFVCLLLVVNSGIIHKKDKICISTFLFFIFTVFNIWNANYTIQAAAYVFSGIIILFYSIKMRRQILSIIGTVFICLGVMYRLEAAMLFIPFFLLELLFSVLFAKKRREAVVQALPSLLICFVCLTVLMVSRFQINNSEKYIDSFEYNKLRSTMQDFPTKQWEEVEHSFTDVSKEEYEAVKNWVLIDTDKINSQTLKVMVEKASIYRYSISVSGALAAIKDILLFVIYGSKQLWILLWGIFLLVCSIISRPYSWHKKVESFLVLIGAFIIIYYFWFIGRAPLHVWISVLLAVLSILFAIILLNPVDRVKKKNTVVFDWLLCIGLSIGIGYYIISSDFQKPQLAIMARTNIDDAAYNKTYEEDHLYLWENWHRKVSFVFMEQGKLLPVKFVQHNMSTGDWTYGQRYYNEYLKQINAENPAMALIERENTYLVAEDISFVLYYMREQYGENITADEVDILGNIPVWKFSVK